MTPERWQQLKQIFQSALERNPAERSAFLNQACADDPALRSQVESLIASHDQAGDSIEAMAAEAARASCWKRRSRSSFLVKSLRSSLSATLRPRLVS